MKCFCRGRMDRGVTRDAKGVVQHRSRQRARRFLRAQISTIEFKPRFDRHRIIIEKTDWLGKQKNWRAGRKERDRRGGSGRLITREDRIKRKEHGCISPSPSCLANQKRPSSVLLLCLAAGVSIFLFSPEKWAKNERNVEKFPVLLGFVQPTHEKSPRSTSFHPIRTHRESKPHAGTVSSKPTLVNFETPTQNTYIILIVNVLRSKFLLQFQNQDLITESKRNKGKGEGRAALVTQGW